MATSPKTDDGILALFGYPAAHENDVERSIQRALADLNRKNAGTGKPELKARDFRIAPKISTIRL